MSSQSSDGYLGCFGLELLVENWYSAKRMRYTKLITVMKSRKEQRQDEDKTIG